ncbi:MAG: hypothetical protein IKY76_08035 [Alistipes sp.]|nr:hypothetical protein [Alistipes sp.]
MRKSISFLLAIFAFVAVVPAFVACENEDEDIKQGPQITLTTNMEVGDAIILRFNRDNRPTEVIGAEKIYETLVDMDGGIFESWCVDITYKITSQTIVLKGNIASLRCRGNELVGLDVSRCPGLSLLQCDYNQLTTLNVSNNPKLEYLSCDDNQLTQLDVSNNPELAVLHCDDNELSLLDISKNAKLEILSCANNKLTSINVSNSSWLYHIDCHNNKIKAAEMSKIIKVLRDWRYEVIWHYLGYSPGFASIYAVSTNGDDGNEISEADVKIAEDKNWKFR